MIDKLYSFVTIMCVRRFCCAAAAVHYININVSNFTHLLYGFGLSKKEGECEPDGNVMYY